MDYWDRSSARVFIDDSRNSVMTQFERDELSYNDFFKKIKDHTERDLFFQKTFSFLKEGNRFIDFYRGQVESPDIGPICDRICLCAKRILNTMNIFFEEDKFLHQNSQISNSEMDEIYRQRAKIIAEISLIRLAKLRISRGLIEPLIDMRNKSVKIQEDQITKGKKLLTRSQAVYNQVKKLEKNF